jgi:hypothetical protein
VRSTLGGSSKVFLLLAVVAFAAAVALGSRYLV